MLNNHQIILNNEVNEGYQYVIKDRYITKEEIVKWLSLLNIKYHLTLSMREETSESQCRNLLNEALKHLNRRIYKGRYLKGKSNLEGLAIREDTLGYNTEHYHLLILHGDWVPEYDRMNHLVRGQVMYFDHDQVRKINKKNRITSYKLQKYFNEGDDGLESYLTKQFEFLSNPFQKAFDSIGILGNGKVAFGREFFRVQ